MRIVAERAKYETFLRELDKDSGSKPANVVARVRADYAARLASIMEQLKASQDLLARHAASLTTQLQKLQEAEQRFLDEAAELDLRKQVGELPESEWSTAVERVRADASKIKAQQEVTAGDIKRIRDVIDSLSVSSGAGTPTPVATPAVDELAFLKAVVGPTTVPLPVPPRIKPIGPPPRQSTKSPAPHASTTPAEPLIEPDPMSVPSAPVSESKRATVPTPKTEALIEKPAADLTFKGIPATKKAKCPKCSGLNIPSDWYCVHCGAELAI